MMMNAWYENNDNVMLQLLAEDVSAPELRNPRLGGLRAPRWLSRLAGRRARNAAVR